MTTKELAKRLTRRERGNEITRDEMQMADCFDLVVVFAYYDDAVEFRGAIDAEVGAYNGTVIYLTGDGILQEPACGTADTCTCPYFAAAKSTAKKITVTWHDAGLPCWTFETDIPHKTFTIFEDGYPWCRGIVFQRGALG